MANDLLGVSISGLRVSQTALRTTGHNIANADTPGFSRQRTDIVSSPGTYTGAGYIGNGANVASIERIVNAFVTDQMRVDTTLSSQLDTYRTNIDRLDTLLSDSATGLSEGLQSFFAAVQNGADDPTSIPSRQLIVSESENLATRFNTLYESVDAINTGINDQLSVAVSEVNALSSAVADLNGRVSQAIGSDGSTPPNDLLDQRDEVLRQLSELISIQTFDQGQGQVNVIIGSGQSLVVGVDARQLALVDGQANPRENDIAFQDELGSQIVTDLMEGGQIGGLLDFRGEVLSPAYNEIGRVAIALADQFNGVNQSGLDLRGQFGGLFFADINSLDTALSRVSGNAGNLPPADQVLGITITDTAALTASDYEMTVEGSNLYRITRLSDGAEVRTGILPTRLPSSIEFDGLELTLYSGSFQAGDQFLLQPTHTGARDIASALVDPEDIAFASPVLTDTTLGNLGSGEITAGEVLSLEAVDGSALPLFATAGEMSPPLLIKFTTATTYDVLDNSDPGNPVDLDPPLRNQTYIPGIANDLFSDDAGETRVVADGVILGLAAGRAPVTQAALQPTAALAPAFGVSDFSASADQFGFDIVISDTLSGINDGTVTVTVNEPAIVDNDTLLTAINNDLSGTDVRAYIADDGSLAFRLLTAGTGNITLQNYNADPDGNGDPAPAGQANTLLGFNIEAATFTTLGGADGISGVGVLSNGYPAEVVVIDTTDPVTGAVSSDNVVIPQGSSAKQIANTLSNVEGVSANAYNAIELSNLQLSHTEPLQITLNGEDLLEYTVDATQAPVLNATVPDPAADPVAFNDYLAQRINDNQNLQDLGIYAVSAVDAGTGRAELRVFSTQGDDLQVQLEAAAGERMDVGDGTGNPNVSLVGAGNSSNSTIIVGGRLDVTFSSNVSMRTLPPNSLIFGDSAAADFATSSYLGIQASIKGSPASGDTFTIDFNANAALDNRNALLFTELEQAQTILGGTTFADGYGKLVEQVGIKTNQININAEAAGKVLEQTTGLRDSVSGVNLDEEAANLIKFEQIYSANAQAISIARDLFDRLISIL